MNIDKLKQIFNSKKKHNIPSAKNENVIKSISNWYNERYNTVVIQRNILLLTLFLLILVVIFAVHKVSSVSSLYTVKPFVIEVEEKSGLTNIVNPYAKKEMTTNETLNQYFIMKYLRTREGYCDTDYKYNYQTVVRLLSVSSVYNTFINYIRNNPRSPVLKYTNQTCTSVKLRSIQFFEEIEDERLKKTAVVRFTVYKVHGPHEVNDHRIASMEYRYDQMELSLSEREVNPLGFQIVNYRVDEEILN